jgi:hypothetical protein
MKFLVPFVPIGREQCRVVGRIVSIIYWRIDSINFGRNTR